MKLRALAPAKVNLCLFIGPVRADGRHQLVTVFESVSLADRVELSTLPSGSDQVRCAKVEAPNLVSAALAGLRERGWPAPPVLIEIEKRIPVSAGLGGGSADAAALLRLARELAPMPDDVIRQLASSLGADVPSQVVSGASIGTGAGEVVKPLTPLAPHAFLILPQPFGLATAEVYREADGLGLPRGPDELDLRLREVESALAPAAGVAALGELPDTLVVNDLEAAALSLRPEIERALDAAREAGSERVMVSGSGPTVIGLFWGTDALGRADVAASAASGRYPGACSASPVTESFGIPEIA